MKMFVFRPVSFGPQTYFVMAETEDEARKAVELESGYPPADAWALSAVQDGEPLYQVEVYEAGQVASNNNA